MMLKATRKACGRGLSGCGSATVVRGIWCASAPTSEMTDMHATRETHELYVCMRAEAAACIRGRSCKIIRVDSLIVVSHALFPPMIVSSICSLLTWPLANTSLIDTFKTTKARPQAGLSKVVGTMKWHLALSRLLVLMRYASKEQ